LRFLLAYLASFASFIVCVVLVMVFLAIGGVEHSSSEIGFFLFSYTLYGLPLTLVGCLIGEGLFTVTSTPKLWKFALLGFLYGAVVYIILSSSTTFTMIEFVNLIAFSIWGCIGSTVFYLVRRKSKNKIEE
jgi:hypothetical protein